MKYFEDIAVGDTTDIPGPTVTKDDIFAFAREWDPQPHHLDEEAANKSILGGLSASGWHMSSLLMRLISTRPSGEPSAFLGSPGVEEARWKKPLLAGDTVRVAGTVTDKRPSESKPFMGLIKSHYEMFNQRDELIMTIDVWGMYARRDAKGSAS